jgi:hypothetical protein
MKEYNTLASFITVQDILKKGEKFFRSKEHLAWDEEYRQAHVVKFYLMWLNNEIKNIDGLSYEEMEQFFNEQSNAFRG